MYSAYKLNKQGDNIAFSYSFPDLDPVCSDRGEFQAQVRSLTYMQSTSWEMLDWKKHKLESKLPGEISITWYADDTTLMAESEEELKSLLMKVKKLA